MANYRRMYALLCKAIDEAITSLEAIPPAKHIAADLRAEYSVRFVLLL